MSRLSTFVVGMAATLLFASVAEAATDVVLWHAYRGGERKALEQVVSSFNGKQVDIQITLLPIPFDAFPDKITAAVPRGKGPDLFIFAQDRLGDWAASGLIESIDFWITDELRAAFLEPTLEALTYDDAVYGLPMAFKTVALYYNTALVKKPPETTDELIAIGKQIRAKGGDYYGLVYENANFYYQAPWLQGFGGRVFTKRGKPALDSQAAIDSMAFAQMLAYDAGIMPEEVTNTLVTSLFNNGKAGMVISGPWFMGEINKSISYKVASLPVISANAKRARPFLTAEGVIMNARSDHKKEAFTVMEFLTSVEAGKIMATVGRQTTARKAVYDDPKIGKDPLLQSFRAQLVHSVPMPNMPAMRMVWSPATTAMNKVINGRADPAAAMKKAQAEVAEHLKGARR
jgi:arabinogalactan oligomer/maltooligosaccharide transport system substrate-binding protein